MSAPEHMDTLPFNVRLRRYAPGSFAVYAIFTFLLEAGGVIPGFIVQAVFDQLTNHQAAGFGIPTLIALFVAIEVARFATSFGHEWGYVTFFITGGALLRPGTTIEGPPAAAWTKSTFDVCPPSTVVVCGDLPARVTV